MSEKKFPTLSCVLAIEVFCLASTPGASFRFAAVVSLFRFGLRRSSSAVQLRKFTRQAERFPKMVVLGRVRGDRGRGCTRGVY